jgi:hypothetical protein
MRRATAALVVVLGLALAFAASAMAGVSYEIAGTEGNNGWYVTPVTLTWHVTGATAPTPDSSCQLGDTPRPLPNDTVEKIEKCVIPNVASVTLTFHIDKTPPTAVGGVPVRPADGAGWYRAPVQIGWTGKDATSGIATCSTATYSGPDGDAAAPGGTCTDKAGNVSAAAAFPIKYDATPPQIRSMKADRSPDHGGWYVKPLSYTLSAVDATSGVDSCPPAVFQGPDDASANATGTCTDRAGNTASSTATLRYDATAPSFASLTKTRHGGSITLKWRASGDTDEVTIRRRPDGTQARSFSGASGDFTDSGLADGVKYTYVVTAADAAGNATTRRIDSSRPTTLISPKPGAKLERPPLLRWRKVRGADYYNVQVFDGKRKLLSAWPARPHLRLARAWRYAGRRASLRRGHQIRWYVWPGYGRPAAQKYGRLLGQGRFTMIR